MKKLSELWNQLKQNPTEKEKALRIAWSRSERELWLGIDQNKKPLVGFELSSEENVRISNLNFPPFTYFTIQISPVHGKRFLEVRFRASRGEDIFLIFIEDLVRYSEEVKDLDNSNQDVLYLLLSRIEDWDQFFEKNPEHFLSRENLIGLWGELLFIKRVLSEKPSFDMSIIQAWQQNSGLDKDFRLPSCSVEVKALSSRKNSRMMISSEVQLESENSTPLYLIGYALSPDCVETKKFNEIIEECRSKMKTPGVLSLFNSKLHLRGYFDHDSDHYQDYRFGVSRAFHFIVSASFPKIIKNNLPEAISGVSYQIDPLLCEDFLIEENEVLNGIN